ncbi:MAG TPA: efflux transporter outer membrane subunit [Sphingorhabdus sp.]|jgi:NodT family efflux transporter outer membrane factor (OMF) lipoprotein|uniref:efflux transporter outer membrane subunit n=1 Tax=Sphingorhabdus sp. TaxID=1902408 RepID=UPI0026AC9D29|nr:efflux transporter outer membrane subunit [Sphingorhabdus sp.]HQS79378.1 efflux transporter outer membrane subunit [Sphingorhabdus sp.]
MIRKSTISLLAIALLAGCVAGPDYTGPPDIVSANPNGGFVRASSEVVGTAPQLAEWWLLLKDPELNRLVEAALANNPSLQAAQARIAQARASVRQERAGRLPTLGTQATVVQGRLPGLDIQNTAPPSPGAPGPQGQGDNLSIYNVGLNANWELDFAGGTQRRIEVSNAQAAAAVANTEDAKVQLTAEVANAYVSLRESQFRAKRTRVQIELQQQILSLTYQQYQQGVLPLFPLGNANAELELLKSQLAEAEADTAVLLDALAILEGKVPGTSDEALQKDFEVPLPPEQVAVGDPAGLVARRPDIRGAERNLAAATAQIGVAEAARFPKLSFMGILGLGGTSLDDLLDVGSPSVLAIPQLQWNFLDFGRIDASIEQAGSARDEAVAKYRQTVLVALQDAERALARFGQQRAALAALAQIKLQADGAADLDRQRFAAGAISRTDLNRTLRKQEQAATDLVRGKAALTMSWIALQKSLGLGWQAPVTR